MNLLLPVIKLFMPQEIPQTKQPGKESKMKEKPELIRSSYKGSNKLLDKVALITGGDSGIGASVAIHFAKEGADIAIVYLDEEKDAQDVKKHIELVGRKCLLIRTDLSKPENLPQIVEKTLNKLKKINILVNNAAVQFPKENLEEITYKQLEITFNTNILSFIMLTKEVLPHLTSGDSIINTSSVTAYRGSDHLLDYSATKGAIVSFTRSLSQNLIKDGIRVNAVAPGPIWTPLIPATFRGKDLENFGKQSPMGRVGQPSEVGPSYVFLASQDSSYMTGQVLHPNGGELING